MALAAAAIAALLVGPVFGGTLTKTKLQRQVNVTERDLREIQVVSKRGFDHPSALVGSLSLRPGDYVVSSTFDVVRQTADAAVTCRLTLGSRTDQTVVYEPGAPPSGPYLTEGEALSVTGRVGRDGDVRLRCHGSPDEPFSNLLSTEITAMKVPKVTVRGGLDPLPR